MSWRNRLLSAWSGGGRQSGAGGAGGGGTPRSTPRNRYSSMPGQTALRPNPLAAGIELKLSQRPPEHAGLYRPAGKLRGMRAVVTDGDHALGRAVALLFVREGAEVLITARPSQRPAAAVTQVALMRAGGRCVLLECDAGDPTQAADIVTRAADAFADAPGEKGAGIDILVDHTAWREDAWDADTAERFIHAAAERMPRGSSVILTVRDADGDSSGMTAATARTLGEHDIRCNAVMPGAAWREGDATPRPPDDLAPAYVFLASNADSGSITGIVLPVTGGK